MTALAWRAGDALDQHEPLAIIVKFLSRRPAWEARESFPVPAELYDAAAKEIDALMKKRGFPRPVEHELKTAGIEHFVLLGTPIVRQNG
jgi:hypothetical protein